MISPVGCSSSRGAQPPYFFEQGGLAPRSTRTLRKDSWKLYCLLLKSGAAVAPARGVAAGDARRIDACLENVATPVLISRLLENLWKEIDTRASIKERQYFGSFSILSKCYLYSLVVTISRSWYKKYMQKPQSFNPRRKYFRFLIRKWPWPLDCLTFKVWRTLSKNEPILVLCWVWPNSDALSWHVTSMHCPYGSLPHPNSNIMLLMTNKLIIG